MSSVWLPDYSAPASYAGASSTPSPSTTYDSMAANPSSSVYSSASSSALDSDADAGTTPSVPDVVANPWNTSLLWSGGILDNRDPRSNFWPIANWRNDSVPANVDTAPIDYYYSSVTQGDSVNFLFTGHGLSVLDYRGPNRGDYSLTIDNNITHIINAYSQDDELARASGSHLPPVIWTSDTLLEGTHSVVMTNLNNASHMNFWGVVINPNNYVAGKSFRHPSSNVKTIIIASTLTATVMLLVFAIIASLLYYFKLVRPRRRLQSQINADRKHLSLLPSSHTTTTTTTHRSNSSSSPLRLDTAFLSSQGDLGRVPSRITATTNESQYWLRPETSHATFNASSTTATTTNPSNRVPALFQEVTPISPTLSSPASPIDASPATELDHASTAYSTQFGEPLSPLSPSNYARPAFWEHGSRAQHHARSHTLQTSPTDLGASIAPAPRQPHARGASTSDLDPFQDAHAVSTSPITLVRSASRRPLPTPPTARTPISPVASPPLPPRPTQSQVDAERAAAAAAAAHRFRVEQDACSIHMSDDDGLFDHRTGETILPPPYAPRIMGRHFT